MKKFLILLSIALGSNLAAQSPRLSSETFWAVQEDTVITVYTSGPSAMVCVSEKQNKPCKEFIRLRVDEPASFPLEKGSRPQITAIRSNGDTSIFYPRHIAMAGTPNFRDVGGLPTANGKTVKWNKVYRCGDMGMLSDNDLSLIQALRIKTVVDFRNDTEIAQSADKYPEGESIQRIHANIGSTGNDASMNQLFSVILDPNANAESAHEVMRQLYVNFARSMPDFKPLFDEFFKADQPLLFHCTAGKDRTGVASALFLYALGVDETTIIEEFYLSNRYTRNIEIDHPMLSKANMEVLDVIMGVHPEYIEAYFKTLREKYGSIDKAMEKELGIDEAKRNKLREKYLM